MTRPLAKGAGGPFWTHHHWQAAAISALLVCYLVSVLTWGRFSGGDEAYFKSPGRFLAETGRLAAPELSGFMNLRPGLDEVFFAYPPMYPWLFSVFVRSAGFGYLQSVVFDALIHVVLVLLTFLITRRLMRILDKKCDRKVVCWSLLPAVLILPLAQVGRPDELAMCFGMSAIYFLLGSQRPAAKGVLTGVSFGLAAATSSGAAIGLGLVGLGLIVFGSQPWTAKIKLLLSLSVVALLTCGLLITPILVSHPDALNQYLTIAKKFAGSGDLADGLKFAWRFGKQNLLVMVAVLSTLLYVISSRNHLTVSDLLLRYWSGGLVALVFYLMIFPAKFTYLWMVLPWLVVVSAISFATIRSRRVSKLFRLQVIGFVALMCCSYAWSVRNTIALVTLPESQRAAFNEKRLDQLIPAGARVIAGEHWWFLAENRRVYDPTFSNVSNLDKIDFIVLSGNGSGTPGVPHVLPNERYQRFASSKCTAVENNLAQEPLTFFGIRISNSAWGHGFLLLDCRERHLLE